MLGLVGRAGGAGTEIFVGLVTGFGAMTGGLAGMLGGATPLTETGLVGNDGRSSSLGATFGLTVGTGGGGNDGSKILSELRFRGTGLG